MTDGETNGKINIHVSVVFVKSLSDLKRQRAQSRHGTGSQQCDANGTAQTTLPTITGCSDVSDDFRRFTGNTAEILNDGSTEKGCCCIV